MKQVFQDEILRNHIAFIGKTGAGKTSTAKLLVEQVVAQGARVCILDSIKSDWWGLTSSADGKSPGLPFHILGGPRGHVPLHASAGKAIGELVATGKLPLSIIDMADFEAGDLQRFFIDFAPTLLKKIRGVLYLIMEESHEFAPKERTGIDKESIAVYHAKKLATAGRSKGLRIIVSTQRVQALHNALLGSCETMVVHRLTAPADQAPVIKWLSANTPKDITEKVTASLSSLKTGSGWVCSGEAQVFEQRQFPRISTYDNSAAPTDDRDIHEVKTAPVNQAELLAIVGDAVKEAEANDPKALKAKVSRLEREMEILRNQQPAAAEPVEVMVEVPVIDPRVVAIFDKAYPLAKELSTLLETIPAPERPAPRAKKELAEPAPARSIVRTSLPDKDWLKEARPTAGVVDIGQISDPEQRILDAIAWFQCLGIGEPEEVAVAFLAEYTIGGGAWNRHRGRLRSIGLIDSRQGGRLALTVTGAQLARLPGVAPTNEALHNRVLEILPGPHAKLLRISIDRYPQALPDEQLASAANYAIGGAFNRAKGRLRSLGLITYPQGKHSRAADCLFPMGAQ